MRADREPVNRRVELTTDCFVTIQQLVKEHCPVSNRLVRHWICHERLPFYRASKKAGQKGKVLIRLCEFDDWMDRRRAAYRESKNERGTKRR